MVRVSEDGRAEIRKLEPLHQHHILLPYFAASYTVLFLEKRKEVAQEFVIYCMGHELENDIRVIGATSI
jgi:hypothetical protein